MESRRNTIKVKLLEIVQILSLYNCYKVDRNFVLINSCVDCSNKTSDMMSIQALPPGTNLQPPCPPHPGISKGSKVTI